VNAKIKSALVNTGLMAVTIVAAITIGSQAPQLYQKWRGNVRTGDFKEHVADLPQRLTLYGTTSCQYCAKARAFLSKAGIAYNDRIVDTSKEAEAMYAKLHENGVPLLVSDKKLIIGFHEEDYTALANANIK
jgi:glutaredoxin